MTDEYTPYADAGLKDTDAVMEAAAAAGSQEERLRYKLFNKVLNRVDRAVNNILRGGLKCIGEEGTDLNHIQRLYPPNETSCFMDDASNILRANTAGEEYHTEMCVYHSEGVKYLIALELQGRTVDVFNLATKARTQHDLSSTLPAASGNWQPVSVCTDNVHAYVLFADTGGSYYRRLHSYLLTDWTANTGWSSSYDCGIGSSSITDGNVIVCADGKLAVNRTWVTVGGFPGCIYIMNATTGARMIEGSGDTTLGSGDYPRSAIASDGEYVYFAVDDNASGNDQFCSMDITNGAAGCGGAGWPLTNASFIYDVFVAQGVIVRATFNGVFISTAGKADGGEIYDSLEFIDVYGSGGVGGKFGFDGSNFWLAGVNSSDNFPYLAKLENVSAVIDSASHSDGSPWRTWRLSDTASAIARGSKIIFDGCDFWYVANGGVAASGIFRFPKPLIR